MKGKTMAHIKTTKAAFMRRHAAKLLGVTSVLLALVACQPMYSLELRGEWRLQNIHATALSNLSSEQTLRWRQYNLAFDERAIQFADNQCLNPQITSDWQQLGVVANRVGVATEVFGLHHETPVQLLFIECENMAQFAFGSEMIRIDENRLILAYQGVLFEFQSR